MAHPYTWIEIDTLVMLRNVRAIRDYIGEGVRLLAVVKANAYGHDFNIMTDALWRGGVDGFVVATTQDALALTEKYPKTPVLLLTPPSPVELGQLIQRGVRLAGVSEEYLALIKNAALRYETRAIVHLELETGMHRFGVTPIQARQIIEENQKGPLAIEALFTHLYAAEDDATNEAQIAQLNELLFELQQADVPLPWIHVASGTAMGRSQIHPGDLLFDGVRCGRILFGGSVANLTTQMPLTWKTKIVSLNQLKRGDTVSYDATYTADRDKTIAVLPVGYFDGLDRRLSNAGSVLVQSKRCPIIGRVCMNNTIIDVSPLLRPQVGDEVVLIGTQGEETITSDEVADWTGTISDEVLARIPEHVPRIKIK
jgi:alanine racemase